MAGWNGTVMDFACICDGIDGHIRLTPSASWGSRNAWTEDGKLQKARSRQQALEDLSLLT